MKSIFAFVLCAFLTVTSFAGTLIKSGCTAYSEETIKLKRQYNQTEIYNNDRSIYDWPTVEANLCLETNTIEVILHNIGAATIGIVDAWNHVFDHDIIDSTEIPTTVHLSTSGLHGTYYIVIYSDYCYAEGTFTI
ncbi:MAG: hypothetical protein K2J62_05270 [Bacteroidales bacterium]|nr:hypothetical protein [Bacteroidales bacterium]